MTVRLTLPANGPTWLPAFARSIVTAFNRRMKADSFNVADVPPATVAGEMIFVLDETGGPTLAVADGSDWLRTSDNAVIS